MSLFISGATQSKSIVSRFQSEAMTEDDQYDSEDTDQSSEDPDEKPLYPTRVIRLSDTQLLYLAKKAEEMIAWDTLQKKILHPESDGWKRKLMCNNGFSVYTKRISPYSPESCLNEHIPCGHSFAAVLAVGTIPRCTVKEIRNFFQIPRKTFRQHHRAYNSLMATLHGPEFVYGTTVHQTSKHRSQSLSDEMCVNTAIFTNSNPFSRKEQWCFLNCVRTQFNIANKCTSFQVTSTTTPQEELFISNSASSGNLKQRLSEIQDLVTFCSIQQIENSSVRVVFYTFAPMKSSNFPVKSDRTSNLTLRNRLFSLAKSVSKLPNILVRRRLGMQRLMDHEALCIQNKRCVCCARKFRLRSKALCDICGYFVCMRTCCQEREREHYPKPSFTRPIITRVRVCERCMDRLALGDYDDITEELMAPPQVYPDTEESQANVNTGLQSYFQSAKRHRLKTRFEQVLLQNRLEASELAKPGLMQCNTSHDTQETLDLSQKTISLCPLSLKECVLGAAEKRSYPLCFSEPTKNYTDAPQLTNEDKRTVYVREIFANISIPMLELNAICDLASQLAECAYSAMSLIDGDSMRLIASSCPEILPVNMCKSREETICMHMICERAPTMLPHIKSDIRFCKLELCTDLNLSFYIGFPIYASDRETIIGSLCCLDKSSRHITQSVYTLMQYLATTAADILADRVGIL